MKIELTKLNVALWYSLISSMRAKIINE